MEAEKCAKAVHEHGPQILGLSALLISTMVSKKEVTKTLNPHGKQASVEIMIGGAPLSKHFSDEIGAGESSKDVASASELATKMMRIA